MGAEQNRRRMAAIHESKNVRRRLVKAKEERGKVFGARGMEEQTIDALEQPGGVPGQVALAADRSLQVGDKQSGAKPLAAHVAQQKSNAARFGFKEVVQIPADFTG